MSVSPRLEDHESEWLAHTNGSPAERARKKRRTASYHDAGNQETGLMRDGESPGIPRFVGSGSGIYFVRTVYDILARSTGQPSRGQSQLVPGEDDQLDDARESVLGHANSPGTSARAPFWRDDEITANHENISFEALIAWTRSYFAIWHPAFPFLHGPEVLETFERVAKDGIESLSGPDAAIIRAMMSVSLADARQLHRDIPSPVPSDLVFLSLDHVASSVLFVLGTPASLKNIQAALRTPHVGRLAATPQPLNTATDSELMSTEMVANPALMPHNPDFSVDMDDQDWLFDPLGALDFSNFAQAGSAESSMGFSFY
ncbi:hypothetical protein N0V93_009948 [Gnomoniopsis smithogilvyi]|uniref:Uncharacterized protein n=1 Tax=Gnomoniopsis smithogilvyi TaxID=1191159 RepID=A0A9W8YIS0_9PEZI|nr:hypothetical protein N0V93_009948 [Gnomoniopsis smithogilvyi]